jgi:hypothetical protein
MPKLANLVSVVLVAVLHVAFAGSASAQNNRSFVSGQGSDSNNCSIAAPCRTFQGALAQTASGGEIAVLDSAGYGPVTITQSVTITNPGGVEAGITVGNGGTAITISPSAAATVTLRGLTLEGGGVGRNGINWTSSVPASAGNGGTLNIIDCVVKDFTDDGILAQPFSGSGAPPVMYLNITNTFALNNATNGIEIAPGNIVLSGLIEHVSTLSNGTGITFNSALGVIYVMVSSSYISNNTVDGINLDMGGNIILKNSTDIYNFDPNKYTETDIILTGDSNLSLTNNNSIGIIFPQNGETGETSSDGTNFIESAVGVTINKTALQ